jgi:hypothetical protein
MDGNTYTIPPQTTAAMAALTHHGSKLSLNRRPFFFRGISRNPSGSLGQATMAM